jgi:hypothetical protein
MKNPSIGSNQQPDRPARTAMEEPLRNRHQA